MKLSGYVMIFLGVVFIFSSLSTLGYGMDKIPVLVSILPQQYFVEKIAGDLADISVLVQPGASPATYEPKPWQMAKMASTKIYFTIGVPFEGVWLPKIKSANPGMRIVCTDEGIQKMNMASALHESHHHRHDHKPSNEAARGLDPHIWTSPQLVKIIAKNIQKALVETDADHRDVYNANYDRFALEIDQLDAALKALLINGNPEKSFMVFHPSWGYFAEAYGLKQIPVEIEGKAPKPAQLQQLISQARDKGIKVIFVQSQFSTQSAEVLAKALGGKVVFADPLAYDWAKNLQQQAEAFKPALK